jgi:broad specificity phosphatase PhoE
MSVLLMARHAQASFHGKDYDELSPLGREQSRCLGLHWTELQLVLDRVYVGPRRRHQQTMEGVAEVYRERGLPWPEVIALPELDEHAGLHVLNHCLPELGRVDPALQQLAEKILQGAERSQRDYVRLFQTVTRLWVRQELRLPNLEAWHEFRTRVSQGIEQITKVSRGRKTVAAFTSGGPVAAAIGRALELNDEKALEASWMVLNAATTQFVFSGERFSLAAFNIPPPQLAPAQRTYL